ncbi:hypothetical protein [Rhodococcus triatomae]
MRSLETYSAAEYVAAVELTTDIVNDIEYLLGIASGIVFVICVAKVIFVGARMAWDHKHGAGMESPKAAEFLAANIGALLAGSASVAIATVLIATSSGPQASTAPSQGNLVQQIKDKTASTQQEQPQDQESDE